MHMPIPALVRSAILASLCSVGLLNPGVAEAATVELPAGGDLQAAINAARPGDTILLTAGVTYIGNFVLPVKSGADYITIRTAEMAGQPPASVRVWPSHSNVLAKIRSNNSAAALRTAPGAHHWRLQLLEFPSTFEGYGDILQIGDGSHAQNALAQVPYAIELDRLFIHGDSVMGQKRGVALNAADVRIRNCYISDIKAVGMDAQAIGGWNGPGPFVIENNYLEASGENFLLGGADPGVPNLVSENVTFRHNYVSRPMSWRDPVLPAPGNPAASPKTGGTLAAGQYTYTIVARGQVGGGAVVHSSATTAVQVSVGPMASVQVSWDAVPNATDYLVYGRTAGGGSQYWTVTGTAFVDTGAQGTSGASPTTIGDRWLVKNLFELKNARNVLIENNVFENNWAHGQAGYAILFTPRNQDGACTWCVVENVTFRSNTVRKSGGGINILGYDNLAPTRQTANIRINQNLFYKIDTSYGGSAWFLLLGDEPRNIVVDHNTVDANGGTAVYVYGGTKTSPRQVQGFEFTNNAIRHNDYGINGADCAFGTSTLTSFFPGSIVNGNWLQGGYPTLYPGGNHFNGLFEAAFADVAAGDYAPASGGILEGRATDGSNIGANIATLVAATKFVLSGALNGPRAPLNVRITTK